MSIYFENVLYETTINISMIINIRFLINKKLNFDTVLYMLYLKFFKKFKHVFALINVVTC